MEKQLQIEYDADRDRLTLDGWDLHCGQLLDVLVPDRIGGGTWRTGRLEYSEDRGWYLIGEYVPDATQLPGLWAMEH